MAERGKNGRFAKGNTAAQGKRAHRTDGGWVNWATGHGMMGRDKREGTYFESQYFSFDALAELWKGDDLAARAIETPVKEALRPGWDLIIPEADADPEGEDANEDESDRIAEVMNRFDTLGAKQIIHTAWCYERGLGGGCVLLGANDGQTDLTKPLDLDEVAARSKFLRRRKSAVALTGFDWMTPLEPREIYPMYGYADPRQPKYGMPEIYRMTSRAVLPPYGGQYAETVFDVHESRLLIFPGIRVSRYQAQAPQGGWGDSVLVRMWRVLRDFNLAWGSTGVLLTEFARGTYKWKDLIDTISTEQGKTGAMARLQFMEWAASTINATVIDAEDDFKREAIPVSGLADLLNQFATRLAACADQPLTVLFGTSPAGLNATGESDIRLFYDRIAGIQQDKLLPQLKRVLELIFLTTGNGEIPAKWNVRFRPLWQETAQERSQAMFQQAQADHIWWQDGVLSSEEIADSHWGSGEWNPEIHINFEARKKQQLATHPAIAPVPPTLGPDGKLKSGKPGNLTGIVRPPSGLGGIIKPPPPPPPPGSAPPPGTGSTTGGQDMGRSPQDKKKAAAPDPNTAPQPNVQNDRMDEDYYAFLRRADERSAPADPVAQNVQPHADPDPWGARSDDEGDDDGLADVLAAIQKHLQKRAARKAAAAKPAYTPPPAPGTAEASKPTTTPGPPAAPDPNTAPQPYVAQLDAVNEPVPPKPEDRTGPAWPEHAHPTPAPQGQTANAAIDFPDTLRADGRYDERGHWVPRADYSPDQPRAANGEFDQSGGASAPAAEHPEGNRRAPASAEEWVTKNPNGNAHVFDAAQDYLKAAGKPAMGTLSQQKLSPEEGRAIADSYDRATDDPSAPETRAAYKAFNTELAAQRAAAEAAGYKFEPWDKPGQPYANSKEMMADVRANKHLYYFKTKGTDSTTPNQLMTPEQNDTFRAVHDLFGHAMGGNQFGPKGETNAFLDHVHMFSPEARKALATETVGQNAWFNFGRANEGKPVSERHFADQKAFLLDPKLYQPLIDRSERGDATGDDADAYHLCPCHRGASPGDRVDYSPDQARDEHGRWAAGARESYEQLAERSRSQGGDTYDPVKGSHAHQGYSVAIYPERGVVHDDLTPQKLKDFVNANADIRTNDHKARVGTWFNKEDGKWYLDVAHVEPHLADAAALGRQHAQKAIYDLKRGEEIKEHEYEDAIHSRGRFASRVDAAGTGPGVRPAHDDAGGDARGDEGVRAQGPRRDAGAGGRGAARPSVREIARLDVGPVTTQFPTSEELAERARAAEGPIPETEGTPSGTVTDPGAGPLAQTPRKKRKGVEIPGRLTSDKKKDHE